MTRAFSIFTMSAWAAFHAVSALAFVLPVAQESGPFASAPAVSALLALGHALGAALSTLAGIHLHRDRDMDRAEREVLVALACGLSLAALAAMTGLGGNAPGFHALCAAATLTGLAFDRRIGPAEDEEAADHRAFLRLAAELGADARRQEKAKVERRVRR